MYGSRVIDNRHIAVEHCTVEANIFPAHRGRRKGIKMWGGRGWDIII